MNDSHLRITGYHLREPEQPPPDVSDAEAWRVENRPESQWHKPDWSKMHCTLCKTNWPCDEGVKQARTCDG